MLEMARDECCRGYKPIAGALENPACQGRRQCSPEPRLLVSQFPNEVGRVTLLFLPRSRLLMPRSERPSNTPAGFSPQTIFNLLDCAQIKHLFGEGFGLEN